MNILTDEEIESCSNFSHNRYQFAREIEAAVLKKLAAQAGEPVGYFFQHEDTGQMMSVDVQQVEWGFEKNNPRLINCGKLYTEAQLIAAQQKAAEACAKLVIAMRFFGASSVADAIRKNWREYL